MIQLLIKTHSCEYVVQCCADHGMTPVKTMRATERECLAWVDDCHWRSVTLWFASDVGECRPGHGFPPGSLLHFSYGAVVP